MILFTTRDTFILSAPCCLDTESDSLESIIAGSDAGARGCIVDLDVTSDGIVVVCGHGGYILPDGSSFALSECTFEETRNAFAKVVTVGQAVETVKSCSGMLGIHLKNKNICAQIRIALQHADYVERSFFIGLSLAEASALQKKFSNLHFMADILETPANEGALIRSAQDAGLFGLRVAPSVLTPSLCQEAHRVGMYIASTESHDEEMLRRLIDMGVNFIETLRPDTAFALLPTEEDQEQLSI